MPGRHLSAPALPHWGRLLLAVTCGAMLFLSCADFDISPLAWVGFLPLFVAIDGCRPRRAFLYGWVSGIVANGGGFYWMVTLLMRFGKMGWLPACSLFLLLIAYQGLSWGAFAYLLRRTESRRRSLPFTVAAPLFLVSLELLMPLIFDWYVAITQAWVLPVIQVADLTGPLGVTFLILLVNGMIYDLARAVTSSPRRVPLRVLGTGCAILLAAMAYGAVRMHQITQRRNAAPKIKVGIVQANIGIVTKGRAELANAHHQLHLRVSRELQRAGAELLVWPESSYPYAMDRALTRDWPADDPRRIMDGIEIPLIFGALSYDRSERYPYNTAFMMHRDGEIAGRFDKNFLLVFGEYIPLIEYFPSFQEWFPAASHFNRGHEVTVFPYRGHKIAPLICYEDILPGFTRRLSRLEPNLLVNITNDAWFGKTAEPYQHLALSVFRSVELRLDLVRAVNTGVSAFVDATGRVRAQTESVDPVLTPDAAPASLLSEAALMPNVPTIYARVGDLFGYLNLVGAALLLLWPTRRRGGDRQRHAGTATEG